MSDNLTLYNAVRQPPKEALKEIQAGRLRGKSDINPMWRIKVLTEQFGLCGIGWKYAITKQWLEVGGKEEMAAFVNIDLCIKVDGVWSDPIPGTGGSSFVAAEKNGLYTSDECFKMALTDAISVSCKSLGIAADVYWDSDSTKYNNGDHALRNNGDHASKPKGEVEEQKQQIQTPVQKPVEQKSVSIETKPVNFASFWITCKELGYSQSEVHAFAKVASFKDWTREMLAELVKDLKANPKQNGAQRVGV